MPLAEKRKAVRHLLDPESPSDAAESYYAFYHAENRTQLYTFPPDSTVGVRGYVCLSRTGMDLFRPLMTMRFPEIGEAPGYDVEAAGAMIAQAIPEGTDLIIRSPATYAPLLSAFFEVNVEQRLKLLVLDRGRYQPVVNVFVTKSEDYDGNPRFVIRQSADGRTGFGELVAASAGINWQTPHFAELYVHTHEKQRRQGFGQSVLSACIQYVLESGRRPVYVTEEDNDASLHLAESAGFVDLGADLVWLEGQRRTIR